MTQTRLTDKVGSDELFRKCGLEDVLNVIKVRRPRWYGHVARRSKEEELRIVFGVEVGGMRPRGRPNETWVYCVRSDMERVGSKLSNVEHHNREKLILKGKLKKWVSINIKVQPVSA